jgi:hypothetical protein
MESVEDLSLFLGGVRRCGMNRKMVLLVATAVLGAALAVAPLASADRPIRIELDDPPDFTGQFCEDFMVHLHATRNNEVLTIFTSGAALITGALRFEVTNVETGETIELNIPGPGRFSEDGSTLIGTGPWLVFGEEGDLGEGSPPQTNFVTGRLVMTFDESGAVTSFSVLSGRVVDICAVLAA